MKWMVILGIACALTAGCACKNENVAAPTNTLIGTKWLLIAWSVSSLHPSAHTITADFGESDISGRSAVNGYGGRYTAIDKGMFSVGELTATEMAGSPDAMRAESLYFDLLKQARKYEVSGTTLTLRNEGNQELLIFQAR